MGKYNKKNFEKKNKKCLWNKRNEDNDSVVVMRIMCTILEMFLWNELRDEKIWSVGHGVGH